MEMIRESARDLPVAGEADVLVVGGGVAGIAAAVAARRAGAARVILIEKSIVLGGLATLGHVCVYLPIDDGVGNRIYGGLAEELLHRCCRYGFHTLPACWTPGVGHVEEPDGRYAAYFNIPAAVYAFDELMDEEGVQVVFDTAFCAPLMEGKTCRGVAVENKSGRSAYLAKTFIDASGDADLLFRAGAPCREGDNTPVHWSYEIDLDSAARAAADRDILSAVGLRWVEMPYSEKYAGIRPEDIPKFHGTSSEDVNAFIHLNRELAREYLQTTDPKRLTDLSLPLMPQYRTTRHLVGKTLFRAQQGVSDPRSVGCMIPSLASPAPVSEFPYDALIDAEIPNIAAAGRIVSVADMAAWGVARAIPACVLSGEAAGTAAALAVRNGCALQDLDVPALQRTLAAAGVVIHMDEAMRENQDKPSKPKGSFTSAVRRAGR